MPTRPAAKSTGEGGHGWRLRVLGPVEVRADGDSPAQLGGPQQRLVMALLVASSPHPRLTDQLITDIWRDDPPDRARKTIQVYVANLRRQLDGATGPLQPAPNGYVFLADRVTIDAVEFERLVADDPADDQDPAAAAARFREALALWVGAPYADVPDAEAIRAEQVRLAELRLVTLERRIDADLALGLHRELIGELEALAIEHPYRERFVAQLMLSQYRAGRQVDALRTFRRARRTLDEELGIEPGVELRELEHRILNHDHTLDVQSVQGPITPTAGTAVRHDGDRHVGAVRGYELRERLFTEDDIIAYRAYQASVGREVTVKVIHPRRANDAEFVRRFEVKAQQVAQLEHPHIASLVDYWRDPDGAYLVTPWLRGGSVADALRQDAWPVSAALRVIEQVGSALSYAHRQGIHHGDVSTRTVLLDEEGNAYLDDFGVAGRLPASPEDHAESVDDLEPATDATSIDVTGLATLVDELLASTVEAPGAVDIDRQLATDLRRMLAALGEDSVRQPRRADDLVRALKRAAGVDSVGATDVEPLPFAAVRNPYKGLRAFTRSDAADFNGRDGLVARLVETVRTRRLVAVVGPSGSGKSSLVRAGLLPHIAGGGDSAPTLVTEMFPGGYPFEELETALLRVAVDRPVGMLADLTSDDRGLLRVVKQIVPDEQHEVLLVIDQFEELFSLVPDGETQSRFLGALTTAVSDPRSRLRVVLTLRADFFDRPLEQAAFGELLERGLVPVTVPSPDELARAVSLPATAVGLELEPGLSREIVTDVEGQPGGLPLLQYALTELFRTRTSNRLTIEDYRRIGGVTGALGTRAEELYTDLRPAAQQAVRQVFLRLVTVDEGADDVRRRVRLSELATLTLDRSAFDSVLERYGSHRLLSFDRDPVTRGPTVEVAHEALLREWRRLREWIETRRADLILHRRFAAAVDEWERAERDPSYLAQGGRLEQFEDGVADSELTLTRPERDFLDASRARRSAERHAAEERAQRQARTNRRLRRLLVGVGVLSVLAAVAGAVAFVQARWAEAAATAADARRVGAQALAANDVDRALLLAIEGMRLDDSPDTRANLLTTLGRSPQLAGVLRGDPDRVFGTVSVSADGRTGAVYDDANRLHFFDTDNRTITATYETGESTGIAGFVTGRAAFHPGDGPMAVGVSTLESQPVRLLDPETFTELPDNLDGFPAPNLLPWGMAYSPDGTHLAVAFDRYPAVSHPASDGSIVAVWDITAPAEPVAVLADVPQFTHDVAFGPDGRLLYTATHAAPATFETEAAITVHDLETQSVVRTLQVPSHPFAVSPDGTHIAAASAAPEHPDPTAGTDVLLIDAETGEQTQRLRGHTGPVTDLAFSPDGSLLASGASDRAVAVWDVTTGDRVELLEGHAGAVASVTFGYDGDTVVSAGQDGAVLMWDRAGDRRFVSVKTTEGDLLEQGDDRLADRAFVSPTGGAVLVLNQSRDTDAFGQTFIQVIDADAGRAGPAVDTGHGETATAVWHPDGERFATAGFDGTVRVWDAATMTVLTERDVARTWIVGLAYIDGGEQLLVAGLRAAPMERLDAETLAPRADPFELLAGWLVFPYAAPEGDTVAIVTSAVAVDVSGNEDQPDDRLLLLDATNGEIHHDIDLGFDSEYADLSPDGARVAVTGDGGQIGLIDVADGTMVRPPITAHDGAVVSVSYAPDGALIASGGEDGRVALWDGHTGDLLGTVRVTRPGAAAYAGFTSDGATVTVATTSGEIHTLDVRIDRWIDHACAIAGRDLTRREWQDAFGDRPYHATCDRG